MKLREQLARQLSADYCCTPAQVLDGENHFCPYVPLENRRRFQDTALGTAAPTEKPVFLKIAVVEGKILCAGVPSVVAEWESRFRHTSGAWFLDAGNLIALDALLRPRGYRVYQAHPFYLADKPTDIAADGWEILRYDRAGIEAFRGDPRFDEAFAFQTLAPDEIGIGARKPGFSGTGDGILGMAGASADSPLFWQIGINVRPEARRQGLATLLVTLCKNAVLAAGRIPYYGTAMSHIASQRTALAAGFVPMWAELIVKPV